MLLTVLLWWVLAGECIVCAGLLVLVCWFWLPWMRGFYIATLLSYSISFLIIARDIGPHQYLSGLKLVTLLYWFSNNVVYLSSANAFDDLVLSNLLL